MIYQAKILLIDELIEEEVTLQIGSTKLMCFASVCPYEFEVNSSHSVELHLFVIDDYVVEEAPSDSRPSIVQVGNSFAHIITGRLNGRYLESGELTFEDDVLLSDFGYLDGKMVAIKVDRIDADFDPMCPVQTSNKRG